MYSRIKALNERQRRKAELTATKSVTFTRARNAPRNALGIRLDEILWKEVYLREEGSDKTEMYVRC